MRVPGGIEAATGDFPRGFPNSRTGILIAWRIWPPAPMGTTRTDTRVPTIIFEFEPRGHAIFGSSTVLGMDMSPENLALYGSGTNHKVWCPYLLAPTNINPIWNA